MEDVFVQTFRIGYQDVFGSNLHHDLKPDGDQILVGQHNKQVSYLFISSKVLPIF